ncbi:unnamed protein product, partial [Mesorhabditis belari]|uniref:Peptidase C1A papain C-terminal domain-containing protein n=1 Tax=Mesorhabditis belari TaxID=2138241 RepID=A0AAF3JAD1_9BILA
MESDARPFFDGRATLKVDKCRSGMAIQRKVDNRKGRFKDFRKVPKQIRDELGDDVHDFENFGIRFRKNWDERKLAVRAKRFKLNNQRLKRRKAEFAKRIGRKRAMFKLGQHPYMHLDDNEFKGMLEPLDLKPERQHFFKQMRRGGRRNRQRNRQRIKREDNTVTELPKEFSWVEKGMTTDVRTQSTCSSCWTFATSAVVETAYAVKNGGEKLDLSEQQLNCVYSQSICKSGWPEGGLNYAKSHGLVYEADVPYDIDNNNGSCLEAKPQVKVKEFYSLIPFDMNEVKTEVMNSGPVAFGMYLTEDFPMYGTGVYTEPCSPDKTVLGGHAMVIVGWGEELNAETNETVPYWVVRNSWGDGWGEDGHIRIQAGVDLCKMESRYLWSAELTDDKVEDRQEDNVADPENEKDDLAVEIPLNEEDEEVDDEETTTV